MHLRGCNDIQLSSIYCSFFHWSRVLYVLVLWSSEVGVDRITFYWRGPSYFDTEQIHSVSRVTVFYALRIVWIYCKILTEVIKLHTLLAAVPLRNTFTECQLLYMLQFTVIVFNFWSFLTEFLSPHWLALYCSFAILHIPHFCLQWFKTNTFKG